jgi:allantoin racemase
MSRTDIDRRIAFINPFGTAAYDAIIEETLVPYASRGTTVDVVHLEGVPANIDYYYPKHLMEMAIFDKVRELEAQGYDGVVVGCCYDPGVRVARELVDIPIVGPLEAAMNHASYFGHSFTIVTDHQKARPWLEDLVRIHGAGNCRGVRTIDWYVTDMIEDTTAVADDAAAACLVALKEDQAEVVILGCTIIGGCLEREIMTTGRHRDLPILNPNLLALKAAETLADLYRMGKYNISRVGLYQKHEQHDRAEAEEVRRRWHLADRGPVESAVADTPEVAAAIVDRDAVESAR